MEYGIKYNPKATIAIVAFGSLILYSILPSSLKTAAEHFHWPSFRLRQIQRARELELKKSWADITTLGKTERAWLTEHVPFDCLTMRKTETSADATALKWLLQTQDEQQIETVLLLHSAEKKSSEKNSHITKTKWGTVCVSSQIGCPLRCSFCATGQMPFERNLTSEEILDQFLIAKREAHARGITDLNVVFMGMGEPLLNLAHVIPAIKILTDPRRFALSPTRITVSTSGIIPGLRELFASELKINPVAENISQTSHSLDAADRVLS